MTFSVVIIVPVNQADAINAKLAEVVDFGPDNLSVALRTTGAEFATHVACHWWATQADIDAIEAKALEMGATQTQIDAWKSENVLTGTIGSQHFVGRLAAEGLERPDRETWIDPPVMTGDTVKVQGKDWRSDVDFNVYEPSVYKWTQV